MRSLNFLFFILNSKFVSNQDSLNLSFVLRTKEPNQEESWRESRKLRVREEKPLVDFESHKVVLLLNFEPSFLLLFLLEEKILIFYHRKRTNIASWFPMFSRPVLQQLFRSVEIEGKL